jgi:hypothetical protein
MIIGSDNEARLERPARLELRGWSQVRAYRNRAAEYLELARGATAPTVRGRYVVIAQHYRTLAKAEERTARRKAAERQKSTPPQDAIIPSYS